MGTSASEILHFVQIPPDPSDPSSQPTYILASRLPPAYHEPPTSARPGVQQILLLPKVNKACILCNWTVTFYSLPELSPVFGTTQIRPCNWIGGTDLNSEDGDGQDGKAPFVTVLASLNKKIRVIKISEDPRALRTIDYAGSTISIRRDSYACVADARSYALLDVDRLLKIPLFPISPLDDTESGTVGGKVEDISGSASGGLSRSVSSAQAASVASQDDRGHSRSTSLGTFMKTPTQSALSPRATSGDRSGRDTPEGIFRNTSPIPPRSSSRGVGRDPSPSTNKPLPTPPTLVEQLVPPAQPTVYLKPHIVSPTPQEFLLVTGTGLREPGVGMFINLEGDPSRSSVEFEHYPYDLVVDGRGVGVDPTPANFEDEEEGYVIAAMDREFEADLRSGLEIQRWDEERGENGSLKYWLEAPLVAQDFTSTLRLGLRSVTGKGDIYFSEVVQKLRLKRFRPSVLRSTEDSVLSLESLDPRTATSIDRVSKEQQLFESPDSPPAEEWEEDRDEEERQTAQRFGHNRTRLVAWRGRHIWWIARSPLALRLDSNSGVVIQDDNTCSALDRRKIADLLKSLRGREAKTETEFLSIGYVRQRAGLLLFMSFLESSAERPSEFEYRIAEEAILEGVLDPRVILATVPLVRKEIVESKTGIWIHGGVKDVADSFISAQGQISDTSNTEELTSNDILQFLRRYLASCRKRKGFGSTSYDAEAFKSVDAALLLVLIQLDKTTTSRAAKAGSVRAELYNLVDGSVDCFERAITILETHNRLYVLSRLYQSKKMAGEVLATWRRILEGEQDDGGEFTDGEQRVREYLVIIRNPSLVQEYGVWLASRNAKLGVQVFAEDRSHVKFEPTQVVQILRDGAPGAVKEYLEYLVFSKNHAEYINELIAYYLDIVTTKLSSSSEARETLAATYSSYRALRAPKPTYRQFITDNTIPEEWWQSRLRLLQLLGGSHTSTSNYDVAAILERIAPFTQELVPEVIILDGKQARHEEAIKLLTHGLGDYDTAISYCLHGGSSIYHPISGTLTSSSSPSSTEPPSTILRSKQTRLFSVLLAEFLQLTDISDRVEQTSSLLERFGGWFEVDEVLRLIPDDWSVDLVSGFLVSALRGLGTERRETTVIKALAGAENLKVAVSVVNRIEIIGPELEVESG